MVTYIPPPHPRDLLPPLLACLPIAFVSARPPPALLPILSPILRQRVQILSGSSSSSSNGTSDSWLPLLNWDAARGAKLPNLVESLHLEPHPTSGEIELPELQAVEYRRLDHETLQARIQLEDFDVVPIYLWCATDPQGGKSNQWLLAELRVREDLDDGSRWYGSITEAEEMAQEGYVRDAVTAAERTVDGKEGEEAEKEEEDDDAAYWAAYDRTPGRTPARTPAKRSPLNPSGGPTMPSNSEIEYFARYLSEVQPAMDPHDPDEEELGPGESTLRGDALLNVPASQQNGTRHESQDQAHPQPSASQPPNGTSQPPIEDDPDHSIRIPSPAQSPVHSPRPRSPASDRSSVRNLETAAEQQSQAEVGIKQHISTDLKSLYRLAKSAGIDRREFERIVKTELSVLEMMDLDE